MKGTRRIIVPKNVYWPNEGFPSLVSWMDGGMIIKTIKFGIYGCIIVAAVIYAQLNSK
ncbi:MAG: hypothetical protein WBL02_06900 [Methanomethylovorans sp.]|uniref:hypothetical protein n=1 Tax=Methanomethylovorans sp. TaxID=2758717 RepID=UPI003C797062